MNEASTPIPIADLVINGDLYRAVHGGEMDDRLEDLEAAFAAAEKYSPVRDQIRRALALVKRRQIEQSNPAAAAEREAERQARAEWRERNRLSAVARNLDFWPVVDAAFGPSCPGSPEHGDHPIARHSVRRGEFTFGCQECGMVTDATDAFFARVREMEREAAEKAAAEAAEKAAAEAVANAA